MRKRMLTAALAALLLGGCGAPAADPAASEPPASGAAAEAETPTADADTNAAPDAAGADPVVTETNTTYYLPDGTVAAETRTTYVYDETGLALSAQVELDGAVLMRTENVYDEAGLRTQALVYDGEGNLTATNTFDAAGNLLSLTGRPQAPGADGEVQEISQTHTYDEQGRLVESESVTAAGTQLDRPHGEHPERRGPVHRSPDAGRGGQHPDPDPYRQRRAAYQREDRHLQRKRRPADRDHHRRRRRRGQRNGLHL